MQILSDHNSAVLNISTLIKIMISTHFLLLVIFNRLRGYLHLKRWK